MVSSETLFIYLDWTTTFTVHTAASDKQLGAVISQNNKPIVLFSRILSRIQCNYTMTEKELLTIVERLKKFRGIPFGYEIKLFSDHKNMVYAETLSESRRLMRWRLILEAFGTNIQHIYEFESIVVDILSRLPSTSIDKYKLITSKA